MSSLAFGLSLAAALCLALASLLQHHAARAVPHDVGTLRLFFSCCVPRDGSLVV